jgi:hypothetical protein
MPLVHSLGDPVRLYAVAEYKLVAARDRTPEVGERRTFREGSFT